MSFQIPDNSRFLVGQYVTIHDDVISHVNITNVKEEDGGKYTEMDKRGRNGWLNYRKIQKETE